MIPTRKLAQAAVEALEILHAQDDLVEGEVFVAANTSLVSRVHFTSHIPCNGVEEPKSVESVGLGIQAVFRGANGPCIGFGSEPNDLTPKASGGPWPRPGRRRWRMRSSSHSPARRTSGAASGDTTIPPCSGFRMTSSWRQDGR